MERRHVVVLAASVALVAGAAVTVPAHAAPPTPDGEYTAPYGGFAGFGSSMSCTVGATCTATGSADAATGTGTTTSSFERSVPVAGRESAFGYARQSITLKTRPGASSVSATFTWRVDASSVEARSSAGLVQAYTGVAAYAANCGGDCSSESRSASVHYAGSAGGVPSTGVQPAATDVSVTVTASGKLPRHLVLYGYPYSVAAGDTSQVCLSQDECTTLDEMHAGSATASIDAVLTSIRVTSS